MEAAIPRVAAPFILKEALLNGAGGLRRRGGKDRIIKPMGVNKARGFPGMQIKELLRKDCPRLFYSARYVRRAFLKRFLPELYIKHLYCSGTGSTPAQTETIKHDIPVLLKELEVETLLDIPCGDFAWLREVDLGVERYIGADIEDELVSLLQRLYQDDTRRFMTIDITRDRLPEADLIFCRDCLVHLSFHDIFLALDNIVSSKSRYLLTTTFTAGRENKDIATGGWRALNLREAPFGFPPPIRVLNENCTEDGGDFSDKSLGLWRVQDLEAPVRNAIEATRGKNQGPPAPVGVV